VKYVNNLTKWQAGSVLDGTQNSENPNFVDFICNNMLNFSDMSIMADRVMQ